MVQKDFLIVGIGASAGGLEALKSFFAAMPETNNIAFVVVNHHDPNRVSFLSEILSKITKIPVIEADDHTRVKPGQIYIAPSAHYLRLEKNILHFHHIVMEDSIPLPIDFFFRSLGEDAKEKAVSIILSGAGSDGALGMTVIKGEGGMAMAQEPRSAQFADMPSNAIATGQVDYILPPERLPEQLVQYANTALEIMRKEPHVVITAETLEEILSLVRRHTGSDFSLYKTNTLSRRIERRMNVHHIVDPKRYAVYLKDNQHEIDLLFKEMLIGVTCFFRDPSAWEVLEKDVLPDLLKDKENGDSVRVWCAGCSTGEEPYSFAILLQEYMERTKKQLNIQIFATDLDDNAIQQARSGIFSEGIALDMTPERLKRFFMKEDGRYRIRKIIRESVVFATQNLIQDPPFTKLDIASCRNVMIYLDATMQKKILPLFHYALRPGGLLFLGSSETVGSFSDLFATIHTRCKLFARKDARMSPKRIARFMDMPRTDIEYRTEITAKTTRGKSSDITELAQKLLLSQHIPPSLIVNEKGDIFFIHGRTGLYLEPPSGPPPAVQNALDMARDGLQLALTAIIRKAAMQEEEIEHRDVRVRTNGHYSTVNLRARRILEPQEMRGLIWISFDQVASASNASEKKIRRARPDEAEKMERELQFIKQSLQNTIEEHEATNEELKSTNEELQSTNEELQSANEELETAKEEMQSLNEELQTVNTELENKINDLYYANDDMKNLLNSTGIATLFLDNDLNIKRFTVQAKKIIHLIHTDIGRPVSDIVSQLEYFDLVKDATEVLQTLVFKELEVRAKDWSWYLMRIMPYRTAENVIDGLVITFVDITKLKKTDILLAASIKALELVTIKQAPVLQVLDEVQLTIEGKAVGIWCSVSLLSEDGKHLHHGSAPSLPEEFNNFLDDIEVRADAPEPCAEAAYHGRAIVMADIANQPPTEFTEIALKNNIKAAWSQPVYDTGGKMVGIFSIYYHQAHHPSPVEEELIDQAVPLLGTAMSRSRDEIVS